MNVGGYPAAPTRQSGLRAAVNARLEEISFRTGLIGAAIALVALLGIAAAGFYAVTVGHGSTTVTVSADNVPKMTPKVPASALPSKPAPSPTTATPKASKAAPARTANSQPAAAAQYQAQTTTSAGTGWRDDAQGNGWASSRGYGRGFGGSGRGFGGYGFRHGGQGFRFPGRGGSPGFGHGWGRH